jgi:hypothetical protein
LLLVEVVADQTEAAAAGLAAIEPLLVHLAAALPQNLC